MYDLIEIVLKNIYLRNRFHFRQETNEISPERQETKREISWNKEKMKNILHDRSTINYVKSNSYVKLQNQMSADLTPLEESNSNNCFVKPFHSCNLNSSNYDYENRNQTSS